MTKYIYYNGIFMKLPKYIYQNKNGRFEIRKKLGGVLVYWGSFKTLEEARMHKAYYMGKNWKVNPAFRAKRHITQQDGKYYIVKYLSNHRETFGTFNTLDDAKRERDICLACDWDLDRIVEFDEKDYKWLNKPIEVRI